MIIYENNSHVASFITHVSKSKFNDEKKKTLHVRIACYYYWFNPMKNGRFRTKQNIVKCNDDRKIIARQKRIITERE